MLGADRRQTRGRRATHSRIYLPIWRGLPQGWKMCLSDHAGLGHRVLSDLPRRSVQHILLVLDGAPNHQCGMLAVPDNISLLFLPPYSPELNPKENLWDEIREKIFKNLALKSMNAVRAKLKKAVLYIEQNPTIVKSITSFPYIAKSI